MSQKNYFVRENKTEQQYFCQLQVSNKFRATMSADEMELCNWMVQQLVHHTCRELEVVKVLNEVQRRVSAINDRGHGAWLVLSWMPLRPMESGFIRIERAGCKHQSVLLPIIDCRGEVEI